MRRMKKKARKAVVTLGIPSVIGLVLIGIGTVVGAGQVLQGEPENIEVHHADGNLLIFRQHKIVDNIRVPNFPEGYGDAFIRGRGVESAVVGVSLPVFGRIGMIKPVAGGVRIDLCIPTSEEIEQMRGNSQKAVDEAIGIIENQKGISVQGVRARVLRSPEEPSKIDGVELWIVPVGGGRTFVHALVDWDSKEIVRFENISEPGMIPFPPRFTVDVEKLEAARLIAMQDNRVKEITQGQRYIVIPAAVMEGEVELTLMLKSVYRISVDLENSRVRSVEEIEGSQSPMVNGE